VRREREEGERERFAHLRANDQIKQELELLLCHVGWDHIELLREMREMREREEDGGVE
jgi:hypothetical protein